MLVRSIKLQTQSHCRASGLSLRVPLLAPDQAHLGAAVVHGDGGALAPVLRKAHRHELHA
eukprot:1717855-Pleurochrysis_carterae.AAC.1